MSPLSVIPARRLALALAALAGTLAAAPAQAVITNSSQMDFTGLNAAQVADRILDTELLLVAWNGDSLGSAPKVVFVKDLGKTMRDVSTAGQAETGLQWSWWLGGAAAANGDPAWNQFLATDLGGGVTPDPTQVRWAVFAAATANQGLNPGTTWLYTTMVQQRSGNPGTIIGLNAEGANMNGANLAQANAVAATFYGTANQSASQQAAANASSVFKPADPAYPYNEAIGIGGPSAAGWTFAGYLPNSAANRMGQSSWFYSVTSADADFEDTQAAIDEFDNSTWDAYWGLAAATDGSGRYLLTYNLAASTSPSEQLQNMLAGNSFARLVGTLSLSSPAGKAQQTLTMMDAFLRGLASDGTLRATSVDGLVQTLSTHPVSAVPEPGSAALLAAGSGLLLGLRAVRCRRPSPSPSRRRNAA